MLLNIKPQLLQRMGQKIWQAFCWLFVNGWQFASWAVSEGTWKSQVLSFHWGRHCFEGDWRGGSLCFAYSESSHCEWQGTWLQGAHHPDLTFKSSFSLFWRAQLWPPQSFPASLYDSEAYLHHNPFAEGITRFIKFRVDWICCFSIKFIKKEKTRMSMTKFWDILKYHFWVISVITKLLTLFHVFEYICHTSLLIKTAFVWIYDKFHRKCMW